MLTGLTVVLAVLAPIGVVASFAGQVARTGNVSHWPWDDYGFFGWWLVPLSLWAAAACSAARSRRGGGRAVTWGLVAVAAATSLSLLYDP